MERVTIDKNDSITREARWNFGNTIRVDFDNSPKFDNKDRYIKVGEIETKGNGLVYDVYQPI